MTEKRLVLPKIELKFKIGTLGYSILMNIMIMLFMILFFYARYDCEIDIAMQSMLYGVSDSGKPCAYLIFSNIVLGKILMILMGIAPKIAWYTVFHYVMILVSLIVISYIIISRNDNSVGHMIAMIVAVFYRLRMLYYAGIYKNSSGTHCGFFYAMVVSLPGKRETFQKDHNLSSRIPWYFGFFGILENFSGNILYDDRGFIFLFL